MAANLPKRLRTLKATPCCLAWLPGVRDFQASRRGRVARGGAVSGRVVGGRFGCMRWMSGWVRGGSGWVLQRVPGGFKGSAIRGSYGSFGLKIVPALAGPCRGGFGAGLGAFRGSGMAGAVFSTCPHGGQKVVRQSLRPSLKMLEAFPIVCLEQAHLAGGGQFRCYFSYHTKMLLNKFPNSSKLANAALPHLNRSGVRYAPKQLTSYL